MDFTQHDTDGFYDEMLAGPGQVRSGTSLLLNRVESLPAGDLKDHTG